MLLDGRAPRPGQIIRLVLLAKTLRSIAEHGKDGFYKGRIADAIVELVQSKGGVMELEDLAKHKSTIVEPISYTYGSEVTIYEVGTVECASICMDDIKSPQVSTKRPRNVNHARRS